MSSCAPRTWIGDGPAWEDVAAAIVAAARRRRLGRAPVGRRRAARRRPDDRAELRALAAAAFLPRRPIVDATRALCHTIHEQFEYDRTFTEVSTPLSAVLQARRGVCQDFAHLAIAACACSGSPRAT